MNRPTRILIGAAALAATALAAVFAWNRDGIQAPGPAPGVSTATRGDGPTAPLGEAPIDGTGRSAAQRREVDALAENNESAAQGVMGWVIDPRGMPLADVPVYLVENELSNTSQRFMLAQKGVQFPPTVQAFTGDDGRFRIGVRDPGHKTFDVRVVHDSFADHSISKIAIQPGDWWDVGAVRLQPGVQVRGQVRMAGSGVPIAGARVALQEASRLELVRVPGREGGLVATTNGGGYYEIPNAPRGIVDLEASAEGFAETSRRAVDLDEVEAVVIDFELERGISILGAVTDPGGRAVPGARIRALSLDPKVNHTAEAFSDDRGGFAISDLHPQQYQLVVEAQGYQTRRLGPVDAGTHGVQLTLEAKGAVLVRVTDPEGAPVREYRVVPRRSFEGGQVGLVRGVAERRITPRDLDDDLALVHGLDHGSYVIEVQARGFAKSFSAPFTMTGGARTPSIEVILSRGGGIAGRIETHDGRPVVGASIRVRADGSPTGNMLVGSPFATLIHDAPQRTDDSETRSADDGTFDLARLAAGRYQLEVEHPEFCATVVRDLEVEAEARLALAPITLSPGVAVRGTASFGGAPTGQLKVVMTPTQDDGVTPIAGVPSFAAITDSGGRFRIAERVPPGRYSISASRQTAGDVFSTILDAKRSARPITVAAAPAELALAIDIPAQ